MGDQKHPDNNMKSFACLAAFLATASAAPQLLGHGLHHAVAHPVAVAHAPVVHHAPVVAHAVGGYAQPDLAEPSPYTYTYAVAGSYSVNLPDGRIQHVKYHANDYDGYVADVTYEGEPHYAAAPVVAHAAPAYHAPVVAHPVAHA